MKKLMFLFLCVLLAFAAKSQINFDPSKYDVVDNPTMVFDGGNCLRIVTDTVQFEKGKRLIRYQSLRRTYGQTTDEIMKFREFAVFYSPANNQVQHTYYLSGGYTRGFSLSVPFPYHFGIYIAFVFGEEKTSFFVYKKIDEGVEITAYEVCKPKE